ncbi:MAG TPA: fumarylacetoacetate hydrolase family protein [Pseudomonadales bacterium]
MILATAHNGKRDGELLVVSSSRQQAVPAGAIAATLQDALERWDIAEPQLRALAARLDGGSASGARMLSTWKLLAPLPRAWQWLDGSAFAMHGDLMAKAFHQPPIENSMPLMYQGMSHRFYGPTEDVPFLREEDGIDFEGEFGVITDAVPMGTPAAAASHHIRLLVQINDWSLRRLAPVEMKTGFGWIVAKPACSMAPFALTPDELGPLWNEQRVQATLAVERNGERFGAVPATEMGIGFDGLVAHAAATRDLCAGTIIGSGTVSHSGYREMGSCCIAERRAIEMIDNDGKPSTSYLHFGERVRMVARDERGVPLFGEIDQVVVQRT